MTSVRPLALLAALALFLAACTSDEATPQARTAASPPVFECVLNEMDRERLVARLRAEMDESPDSIRIYRLREPRDRHVRVFGVQPSYDLRDALVF